MGTRIDTGRKRIFSHIVTPDFDAMVQAISDVREWKRPLMSMGALMGWLLVINFFQLWMVPLGLCIGVAATGKKKIEEESLKDEKLKKDKKEKKEGIKKDFNI